MDPRTHVSFSWLSKKAGLMAIALLIICGLAIRLTYLWQYDIIGLTRDSFLYGNLAYEMSQHHLPVFNIATPGYPLFLFVCSALTSSLDSSIALQVMFHAFILLISLTLVFRYARKVFLPIFISLALFYLSPEFISQETTLSTIALFTSILILIFALVVCTIYNPDNRYFLYSLSIACFALIFTRPQGLFITAVLLFFALFFIYSKRYKNLPALLLPFAIFFIFWMSYNKCTFGKFAFSNYSAQVNLGSSIFLLEKSEHYPSEVNESIDSIRHTFTEEELATVSTSLDYNALSKIITIANWDKSWLLQHLIITRLGAKNYNEVSTILNRIANDGKKKRPALYAKIVAFNFISSQKNYGSKTFFLYNELTNRVAWSNNSTEFDSRMATDTTAIQFWLKNQYFSMASKSLNHKGSLDVYSENFASENRLLKCYFYWQLIYAKVIQNSATLLLFYLSLIISTVLFLLKKVQHDWFCIILFSAMIYFGNLFLVSLSILPIKNYTFPLNFSVLIPISLLAYLIIQSAITSWHKGSIRSADL